MPRVLYSVKATIAQMLYWLGILDLWRSIALRNKAVVLMYHRVLAPAERERTASHPGYVVSLETFARQMAYLSRHFTVLSERQFIQRLDDRSPFPDSTCLITFDDGWKDNLTNALPVLRQHRLPATIFLPVNFIGTRRLFSREALTHLLLLAVHEARRGDGGVARVRQLLDDNGMAYLLEDRDDDLRSSVIEAVQQHSERRGQDRWQLVEALQDAMRVVADDLDTPDTFLDWGEVAAMAECGVSFGGHGVEHRQLGELSGADADQEIRAAMRVTSSHVGQVVSFSYPNGSFTPEVREMVQAAGYQVAFTTDAGVVQSHDDRFTIRRVNVHEDMTRSIPMFLARILGLF